MQNGVCAPISSREVLVNHQPMQNPCKWPSVNNLARVVPELILKNNQTTRHRIHDIISAHNVFAVEKLDGSNFGKTDTGVVVSRNMIVLSDTFSKTSVSALPSQEIVQELKRGIEAGIKLKLPTLTVYGELLHNNRYTYKRRNLGDWRAFGITLDTKTMEFSDITRLIFSLRQIGYWVVDDSPRGAIVIIANDHLFATFKCFEIPSAPVVAHGTFEDVCGRVHPSLLDNETTEGVILTSPSFIFKWKNAWRCAGEYMPWFKDIRVPAGSLEWRILGILLDVVSMAPDSHARPQPAAKRTSYAYSSEVLSEALQSAESKYDSIEAWLDTPERTQQIAKILRDELGVDLEAATKGDRTCIGAAVAARIAEVKRAD